MKQRKRSFKKSHRALRVAFSYERSRVRLVSHQSVEMVTPPSDSVHPGKGEAGFWYELRDPEGRTLYRRVIQNPIKFAAEVRSDDPTRPLTWQSVPEPRGDFVLQMPELVEASTLVLFSSPLEPEAAGGPAKELIRFDLKQGPEGKEVLR